MEPQNQVPQSPPPAPNISPEQNVDGGMPEVYQPPQPPTQTAKSSRGGISARSKVVTQQREHDPQGGNNSNGGGNQNGNGQGNGQNGGNQNGGGKGGKGDNNGDGGGKKDKGGKPWYLQGLNRKDDKQIMSFLKSDPTFQQQVNDFLASKNDYIGQAGDKSRLIKTDFDKNIKFTKDDRQQQESDLLSSMAASGLARSSGYLEEQGNIQADIAQQRQDLISDRNFGLQEVTADKSNFLRQLTIMQQQARAEALRRKAAEDWDARFGGIAG